VPGDRFLGYLQNHDQIGNRATGDRISQLVSVARAKVGAALVLTAPFVPLLFMGEEWAASTPFLYFTDHEDSDLGHAVRAGRQNEFRAFGWDPEQIPDPQDPTTFDGSRLRWDEVHSGEHADMLTWYRRLIALRRAVPDLADPRLDCVTVAFDDAACWLLMRRGDVRIAANLGRASHDFTIATDETVALQVLLASPADACPGSDGRIRLAPDSVAIVGPVVAAPR
jgi:maltooligosyltrehalose trehalohydrolase